MYYGKKNRSNYCIRIGGTDSKLHTKNGCSYTLEINSGNTKLLGKKIKWLRDGCDVTCINFIPSK